MGEFLGVHFWQFDSFFVMCVRDMLKRLLGDQANRF